MADALKVVVRMDKRDFTSDAEAARMQMVSVAKSVQDLSTELATMRGAARAAGGATDEQTAQFKKMETQVKSLRAELGRAAADYKTLSEIAPPAPKLPEVPVPGGHGNGSGIGRMQVQEIGHSVRAMFDSVLAGMPIDRVLEMETPRLVQALGPAAVSAAGGLSGLLAVAGPLVAVVAAATGAFALFKSEMEDNRMRRKASEIGQDGPHPGIFEREQSDWKPDLKSMRRRAGREDPCLARRTFPA